MTLSLHGSDASRDDEALADGERLVEHVEATLSRFRPESELSRLNARTGEWVAVSSVLAEVLRQALRAARRTGGVCTPTILSALLAAGYDRDFSLLGAAGGGAPNGSASTRACRESQRPRSRTLRPRRGAAQLLRAPRRRPPPARSWRFVTMSPDGRVRLPRGIQVDVAGVAKGWTADRVADLLSKRGPCLVDAGGDLAARGCAPGLDGWPIAVVDPHRPDEDLALVIVRDAGIATSGIDFRRWSQGGRDRHHLIDPRTGAPAETDVLTATVIAPRTADADVYAKVALLLGATAGWRYLERRGLAGLIVRQDGGRIVTPRWRQYAYATPSPARE